MAFFHHAGTVSALSASDLDIGTILTVDSVNTRVGVGTASPAVTLEVHNTTTSSAHTGGQIRLSANDGAPMGDSHRLGAIEFSGAEDSSGTQVVGARIEALTDAAWTNVENGCALYFYTTDGNASQTNVLKLDSNQKATFSGLIQGTTATFSGLATFNGNATVLSGSASALSKVTLGTDSAKTTIGCPGGTDTFFTATAAGDLVLRADDNNNKVHIGAGTSGKAAMVVTEVANVGKVGVGTASPGAQLDIQDTTTSSASTGGHLRLSANDGAAMGDSHRLGVIEFTGAEDTGGSQTVGARIESMTDAAWSASENGAALYFFTTDGNASQSQVLKLDSNKKATFAGTVDVSYDSDSAMSLSHDGTNAYVESSDGDIILKPQAGNQVEVHANSGGTAEFQVRGLSNDRARIALMEGSNARMIINSDFGSSSREQNGIFLHPSDAGNHLILGNLSYANDNHDHSAQTNPTLFVHSATDPDTANTQWVSLAHDQTNGVIDVGTGAIKLDASVLVPDDATIGSASDPDAVKISAAGNLAHRGAVTHSTSTSDIDLTSTTHSTTFVLDAVMAAGQAITLPQPTAALAGMVIDIHLIQDCTTSPNSTGPAIGLADSGSGTIRGALTLMSTGATMDTIAIPTSPTEKALWLDSNAATHAGGAAGSHYQFIYSGSTAYVYVKAVGMTTAATPALTVYAFADSGSGGDGTS